ncbi:MAG: glycosyltransferase family 1 protein [Rhodococcus sp. (in: high G+C Gram-positive bacteria)]|nr:MAG: glycosyltransferase family 1 protein [Rhodococcus sp. (in: high G+C Gram-positive bacteria)]
MLLSESAGSQRRASAHSGRWRGGVTSSCPHSRGFFGEGGSPVKVLVVSDSYPPAAGGLERAVHALATGLAGDGTEVTVATLSRGGTASHSLEGLVVVHHLPGWTRFLRPFTSDPTHQFHPTAPDPALTRHLQRLVDRLQPDVVHAHGWILHSCLRLRLPRQTALVVTLHDYGLNCAKKTLVPANALDTVCPGPGITRCLRCASEFYGAPKAVPLVLGLAESQHLLDRVGLFLPISTAVAESCLEGVNPDRVAVIPSFVPDDVGDEGLGDEGLGNGTADFLPSTDYLLFIGAIGPHKGITTLLDAQRLMPTPIPLVVIGMQRPDTPSMTGDSERRVIVRTNAGHQQVMAAMRRARVVCVPSRWAEPQGLVAIEAMSAGTPVVASDIGGLRDVIDHNRSGLLVPPGNAAELARALELLLNDHALHTRLADGGRTRARAYTESTVLPQVRRAYARAISRRAV